MRTLQATPALMLGLCLASGAAQAVKLSEVVAEEKAAERSRDYDYCELAGAANGMGKEFVGTVAARVVSQKKLLGDKACHALWQQSYKEAEVASRAQSPTREQLALMARVGAFEGKIADAVIAGMAPKP